MLRALDWATKGNFEELWSYGHHNQGKPCETNSFFIKAINFFCPVKTINRRFLPKYWVSSITLESFHVAHAFFKHNTFNIKGKKLALLHFSCFLRLFHHNKLCFHAIFSGKKIIGRMNCEFLATSWWQESYCLDKFILWFLWKFTFPSQGYPGYQGFYQEEKCRFFGKTKLNRFFPGHKSQFFFKENWPQDIWTKAHA